MRSLPFSSPTSSTTVEIPILVETDLEADESGTLYVVNFLCTSSEDYGTEARIPFEDIVDNLVEFYQDWQGARPLYLIANELARQAERLRVTADRLEGMPVYDDESSDEE